MVPCLSRSSGRPPPCIAQVTLTYSFVQAIAEEFVIGASILFSVDCPRYRVSVYGRIVAAKIRLQDVPLSDGANRSLYGLISPCKLRLNGAVFA